ncbi:MAG TPA: hypothetical protein VHH33_05880 [Nitrososphaeraceae archaeon]|jgi:hypothetical protein|nr:hypothetical protein [Nitrososphaeraceae archaeon]
MVTSTDDTGMRFLIALIAGPMIGWALGYFIRKSIKVIAFIGGMMLPRSASDSSTPSISYECSYLGM